MLAIKVSGEATLKVKYEIELDMSESDFENLTVEKQDQVIENAVNWMEVCRSAEVDDIDVWDYREE